MSGAAGGAELELVDTGAAGEPAEIGAFAAALACDLELIADLHDREPTETVIEAVCAGSIADELALRLASERSLRAIADFGRIGAALPRPVTTELIEDLASAWADVYLRYHFRVAPTESVWLTEEALERQGPMFRVRDFYRSHGLAVADAENRPDDHLVLELRFLAHLASKARNAGALEPVARFLDAHILRWIGQFADRLAARGAHPWFVALGDLTAGYLTEAREHLAAITGIAVSVVSEHGHERSEPADARPSVFVPGAAPTW